MGPTLAFRGLDNNNLLPPRQRRPQPLLRHDRHRQQPPHAQPARPAGSSWTRCATGSPRCTSTASASTSPRPWPASSTRSTRRRPSSTSSSRTRSSARSRLIAEPWDVGEGGYQVGNFPPLWTEWNGKFRDTVRDFWRGEGGALGEFASRFTGSSDLYEHSGRKPIASINFVTAHDGFTLRDLVSYNEKHNEANGEGNNDGESHNRSWNCGVEGPTNDPEIRDLRLRQQRNFLTTLLFSQGVPMLLHGDEARPHPGRQQQRLLPGQRHLVDPVGPRRGRPEGSSSSRSRSSRRREHPVFRRRRFFAGNADHGGERAR